VNFYSRVQMYLFKAKQAAIAEYERALTENGVTRDQVKAFLDSSPKFRSPFYKPAHKYCGNNADSSRRWLRTSRRRAASAGARA